ncbi:hypothetical protein O3P69_013556 [Scylla paramamosain]|uniref:Uncharacterized protein n=1 Tax=Scylla paramamosain TaxID=85552 RepID=A0AAW0SF78_SCYPA
MSKLLSLAEAVALVLEEDGEEINILPPEEDQALTDEENIDDNLLVSRYHPPSLQSAKLSTCKRNPVSSHVPLPNNCRPGDAQRDKCAEWSIGANVTDGAINFPLQAVSYPALYAPVMKNKEAVASRFSGDTFSLAVLVHMSHSVQFKLK